MRILNRNEDPEPWKHTQWFNVGQNHGNLNFEIAKIDKVQNETS